MTREKTLTRQAKQRETPSDSHDDEPSELLRQVEAHARVAQEAYSNCRKGVDAEQELLARRNTSAQ
jgi:hypothetical protein